MHKKFQTARWRPRAAQGDLRFSILLNKAIFPKLSKNAEIFMVVPNSILMEGYIEKNHLKQLVLEKLPILYFAKNGQFLEPRKW